MVRPVLATAIVVLLVRMMLSMVIVPPWQQPDEPIHVSAAEVWRSRIEGEAGADPGRQSEIIESMVRHGWWRHYGRPLPSGPQPTRFIETGAVFSTIGLVPESSSYAPPYYATVGWLLSPGSETSVERDLYAMRVVSMLFAVGTLLAAFRASQLALDDLSGAAIASLLALQPQFALAATTAGPDAVVNFAGSILWWQTMAAIRTPHYVRPLVVLWVAAAGAAMIDRLGIVLLPIAWAVTAFVLIKRLRFRTAAMVLACIALSIVVATATIPAIRSPLRISLAGTLTPSTSADALQYTARFIGFLFSSWWYSLGWVRYVAPSWWVGGATVITVIALSGLPLWFARPRDNGTRTVIALAGISLVCVLGALAWVFLRVRVGAQGRYLFPVIVPTLTLLWLGTAAWVPARFRHVASATLAGAFAVLDVLAWVLVALPAYS